MTESKYDYDLFCIGAGSGGVRASRMAGSYGAKVAVAEEKLLGGTCVNVGCVPKKLFVVGSQYAEDFADAEGFGWNIEATPSISWRRLLNNKNSEIERLNSIYRRILYKNNVELFEERATVADAHTVKVGDRQITARYILIATGGRPSMPEIPGIELAISSNEMFFIEELPRRAIVVGGGYIGVEFASILNGFGVETTLVYRRELFLRAFDIDVRRHVAEQMKKKGVKLRFSENVASLAREGEVIGAKLESGETLKADLLLYATGRRPNTAGLGLEQAGVELAKNGAIVVNDQFQSSVDSIYAVGDVIDRVQLTPVAIVEGAKLAAHLFDGKPLEMSYDNIATAVFCQPNIGTVGLSEDEALARGCKVETYRSTFRPLRYAISGRDEQMLMKLVVDADSDRVLGCHMVGLDAGEIIQGFAVALQCRATKAQFDATMPIHPTRAEEFVTMSTKATPTPDDPRCAG